MNRRGFLSSCLALAAAPAIVRADSLMRIVPRDLTLLMPWQQEISSLIGYGDEDFATMVSRVLRKHRPQIIANIKASNAMYRQFYTRHGEVR